MDVSFWFKAIRYQVKSAFFDILETLQVKSFQSKTADGTHKTETFYVKMSRNEAIFDGFSPTKEDIVHDLPVDDEET